MVAVGAVQVELTAGGLLDAVFCDVSTFRGDLISRLETYQVILSSPPGM